MRNFMTSQRLNKAELAATMYGWFSHNRVSHEPDVIESGFVVQIIQKS